MEFKEKGKALPAPATSVRLPTGVDENRTINYVEWTSMVASVRLPTGIDENHAINCIATVLIPMVCHRLEKGYGREWLQTTLQKGLREGRLTLTNYAIQAAEAGDEIADAALRTVFVEIVRGELPDRQPGHLHVRLYGEREVLQPHKRRRSGRPWRDNWVRDIQICMLIYFVCRELGVRPTRNREERRADRRHAKRAPSGISLVVAALARAKITHLEEKHVQEKIWGGLPGELVRTVAPTLVPTGNCG